MTVGADPTVNRVQTTASVAAKARTRSVAALAVALWLFAVAAALAEFAMIAVTLDRPSDQFGIRGYEAVLALSFGTVGALIATRRPENSIGWLSLVAGLAVGIQGIVVQYPVLAESSVPALAGADVARWVSAWIWVPSLGAFLGLFPLLFPDGRLLSPRWWPALALAAFATAAQISVIILVSQPLGAIPPTNNSAPYFAHGGLPVLVGYSLLWLMAAVSTTSLIQRYRRSRGDEREQIKWVAYAVVLVVLGAVVGFTPFPLGQLVFLGTALFAAAAVAIAILRYRLYEIDLIINRTLVYGALSAILAGVYTASITLSTRLFSAMTGERSDAAIVLTTLIVVALFTPLKTRLQAIVDRRVKAAPRTLEEAAVSTSLEALDALARLIELNASGGLTPREFRAKKTELLRRV